MGVLIHTQGNVTKHRGKMQPEETACLGWPAFVNKARSADTSALTTDIQGLSGSFFFQSMPHEWHESCRADSSFFESQRGSSRTFYPFPSTTSSKTPPSALPTPFHRSTVYLGSTAINLDLDRLRLFKNVA